MIIIKTAKLLKAHLQGHATSEISTGFVPTMGALHEGHLALVTICRQQLRLTIVSIFINPTQFNDPADFDKYPVTLEKDIEHLEKAGCDILFLPSVAEIYPDGIAATYHYELGDLEHILEGFYRPRHFQGVCQVVHRLLDIVQPTNLYLGRKDYQQCMVIKKMLEQIGLALTVRMVPTIREDDGLAMSSRNMRLNADSRKSAASIFRQMKMIESQCTTEPITVLQQKAITNLLADGFSKIDYVNIADPVTLQTLEQVHTGMQVIVLVAAFINNVRLIDNLLFEVQ